MPGKYPLRKLVSSKPRELPDDTWLFDYPDTWRTKPETHPARCTWCTAKFDVVDGRWRFCRKCDAGEK